MALNMPIHTVLYEMSMANLLLYTAAIPHYGDKEKTFNPALDADNPDNFNDMPDGFV